jgi:hypothetical protein
VVFPTTGIVDDFDRADEDPVSDGGAWSNPLSGLGVGDPQVTSNQLAPPDGGDIGFCVRTEGTSADQEAYYTIATLPASPTFFIVSVRCAGTGLGTDGLDLRVRSDDGAWSLRRVVDLTPTTVASGMLSGGALVAGDSIGLDVIGNTMTGHIKRGAAAWAEIVTAGEGGTLTAHGPLGLSIDVVTGTDTTWRIDNFGGGDVVAAGGVGGLVHTARAFSRARTGTGDAMTEGAR